MDKKYGPEHLKGYSFRSNHLPKLEEEDWYYKFRRDYLGHPLHYVGWGALLFFILYSTFLIVV